MKRFRYGYEPDGVDEDGEGIPDVPVVYLVLEAKGVRAKGLAIVDTGFDGGVYPNIQVVRILKGMKPVKVKRLETQLYEPVSCEVFRVKASLIELKSKQSTSLGLVNVYVPVEPEFLSDEVLVGREVLNRLKLELNGSWVKVETP